MVFIEERKFACQTCIKGHRSSSCTHTTRLLFEIKKKGRPVTQCEHCRQLRKTKQVHVKCMCGAKSQDVVHPPVGRQSDGTDSTASELEHSACLPGDPAALHTDSSSSSDESHACACADGAQCNCWTPRNSIDIAELKEKQARSLKFSDLRVESPSIYDHTYEPKNSLSTNSPDQCHLHPSSGAQATSQPLSRTHSSSYPTSATAIQPPVRSQSIPADGDLSVEMRNALFSGQSIAAEGAVAAYDPLDVDMYLQDNFFGSEAFSDLLRGWPTSQSDQALPSFADILGGCQCGSNCPCPGCAHNPNDSPIGVDGSDTSRCPLLCSSCFDCVAGLTLSTGISSVDELLALASNATPQGDSTSTSAEFNVASYLPASNRPESEGKSDLGGDSDGMGSDSRNALVSAMCKEKGVAGQPDHKVFALESRNNHHRVHAIKSSIHESLSNRKPGPVAKPDPKVLSHLHTRHPAAKSSKPCYKPILPKLVPRIDGGGSNATVSNVGPAPSNAPTNPNQLFISPDTPSMPPYNSGPYNPPAPFSDPSVSYLSNSPFQLPPAASHSDTLYHPPRIPTFHPSVQG